MAATTKDSVSDNEHEVQGKITELAAAVKDLTQETKRLKGNLDKMHSLQVLLYEVTEQCVNHLESSKARAPLNVSATEHNGTMTANN